VSPASPGGTGGLRPVFDDDDREQLVALLREHFAQGRLSLEELSRRVGIVLAAEFADEAAPAVGDLPALGGPGTPGPPGSPQRLRRGRHGQAPAPGPGWLPTSERFRDPATGAITRVWIDPADQTRHYIPEP
jgi:uncharacterized protein DUF1707